jgi:hypothetical protein
MVTDNDSEVPTVLVPEGDKVGAGTVAEPVFTVNAKDAVLLLASVAETV